MVDQFYSEATSIKEAIRARIAELVDSASSSKLRDVVLQRNASSSFVKGVMSYYVHEGLGGQFDHRAKVDLASAIEIFCSSGALLDNVIDGHEERNGKTTFLAEFGPEYQIAAAHYTLHLGLRLLFPHLVEFTRSYAAKYRLEESVMGVVHMDLERSASLDEQIRIIEKTNGLFSEVPLVIAATTATTDASKIRLVGEYGFNLGTAFGVYEELRDLLGEHGRRRATEVETGRVIIPVHFAIEHAGQENLDGFVGKRLADDEYAHFIHLLVKSRAIEYGAFLTRAYLSKADASLRTSVSDSSYAKLRPLQDAIDRSLTFLLEKSRQI